MAVKTWAQLRTAFADNNTGDITASDLRDLVDTVQELFARQIAITVSNSGNVSNAPGSLPITAQITGAGQFTLTCPIGYVWQAASGSGNNLTEVRSITTNGAGTRELSVSVFNHGGTLQTVSFYLMGTLREA